MDAVERLTVSTAIEMNRLEPKLRISVKTAEPSVTWRGGRVEKAITVIGVKAIDWPRPSRKLPHNTSESVRLMSNPAIQNPAPAWSAMPQTMAKRGATRVSWAMNRKAVQLPTPRAAISMAMALSG